jgi:hypothetical protein
VAGLVPALGDYKGSPLHIVVCMENPKEPKYVEKIKKERYEYQ